MDIQQIEVLISETLNEKPLLVNRMTLSHSGSTIYDVELASGSVILRLDEKNWGRLTHTAHNIAVLTELGLPVPRMLAVDLTRTRFPCPYIVLEKIPGRDLLYELDSMTHPQITRLAQQIVSCQRKVATLPPATGFGYVSIGEPGYKTSWREMLHCEESVESIPRKDTLYSNLYYRAIRQAFRLEPYFKTVTPLCFLYDHTTLNVMILNGEFQGLIDFDDVCYGDPLFMIGLTAGCVLYDVGVKELFYVEELSRFWNLNDEQKRAVTLYSVLRSLSFLHMSIDEGAEARIQRLAQAIEQWLITLEQA